MSVKVFFDLNCPFCYLGRGYWLKMQQELPVETEWVPWEAHPEMPLEGFPKTEAKAEADVKRYRALGGEVRHFEKNLRSSSTHNALLGLEFARAAGKEEAYIERLFAAYFAEGLDISPLDTVARLAKEVGLDGEALKKSVESKEYEAVLTELDREAEGMGLEVVPSFVRGGKLLLAGSTTMTFEEFREKYRAAFGPK